MLLLYYPRQTEVNVSLYDVSPEIAFGHGCQEYYQQTEHLLRSD